MIITLRCDLRHRQHEDRLGEHEPHEVCYSIDSKRDDGRQAKRAYQKLLTPRNHASNGRMPTTHTTKRSKQTHTQNDKPASSNPSICPSRRARNTQAQGKVDPPRKYPQTRHQFENIYAVPSRLSISQSESSIQVRWCSWLSRQSNTHNCCVGSLKVSSSSLGRIMFFCRYLRPGLKFRGVCT